MFLVKIKEFYKCDNTHFVRDKYDFRNGLKRNKILCLPPNIYI